MNWHKLTDWLIRFLMESGTIYIGPGTYHWINHEGKILIRNSQRIVGAGPERSVVFTGYQGIVATTKVERWQDIMEQERVKKETQLQANAYYDWLEKMELK